MSFSKLNLLIFTVIVVSMGVLLTSDDSDAATYTGDCGENLTWTVDTETETLTISGTGTRMTDYDDNPGLVTPSPAPWKQYANSIYFVEFECENLEYIGNYVFNGLVNNATVYLSHLPLTEIGFHAFYGSGTVHLNLPDTLETIGAGAFQNCNELIDVKLGEGVQYIGNYAFAGPSQYIDLMDLPDSLTFIGVGAFNGWKMSERLVTLPNNTVQIMDNAFGNTSGCNTVYLPKDFRLAPGSNNSFVGMNPVNIYNASTYDITLGSSVCGHIAETSATKFIQQGNSGRLGDTLGWTYFSGTKMLRISGNGTATPDYPSVENYLPIVPWIAYMDEIETVDFYTSNLATLGNNLFKNHTALKSVTVPETVTNVKSYVFAGCTSLKSVDFKNPDTVLSGTMIFSGDNSLTHIGLPKNLTEIPNTLCYMCKGLETVEIPGTVTTIGDSAFYGCEKLNVRALPKDLVSIGRSAFSGCRALALTSLPDGVTTINERTFENCSAMALDSLPSALVTVGNYAFSYNSHNVFKALPDNLTTIGSYAFAGNVGLTELTVPASLTTVGNNAFNVCRNLGVIFNQSDLNIFPGADTYGGIAKYADAVVTPAIGIQKVEERSETTYTPIMMAIPAIIIIGIILAVMSYVGLIRRSGEYVDYDSDYGRV